jgi:bidirectional [NiFe] hydrogenase diaphorase subunit
MKAPGKHSCVLCTGNACYIKGVPGLLAAVNERYGIEPGETTKDGQLSLMTARCVGACGLAPVAVIDGEFVGKLTPEALIGKLEKVRES